MADKVSVTRLSTGNEFISIPDISTASAGIENVGIMHSAYRACIELHGAENRPLLKPVVEIDGQDLFEGNIESNLVSYWIPRFTVTASNIRAESIVFAPLERRGFVCVLTIENTSNSDIKIKAGWQGCWQSSIHAAKQAKQMYGVKYGSISSWQPGVPVIEFRGHAPLFAIALVSQDIMPARIANSDDTAETTEWTGESISAFTGVPICYELLDEYTLQPNEKKTIPIYVGIGLEEVSAIASGQELRLHGWERIFSNLKTWLAKRIIDCDDDRLKHIMNVNSFYNYFFSQAIALDTEQLVITSARSSQNDSCAAYGDRDAMRWALPAVLQVNWARARDMLIYAFTTQLPNVGVHSRFIDGIVLEPGIQLDQLCAPIRALHTYVQLTGDMSVLFDRRVQAGMNTIQQILAAQRHPEIALFETLLLPSGEPSKYPYVCYSNVLVWRVLLDLSRLYDRIRDLDRSEEARVLAGRVRAAVWDHFVVHCPSGKMFARGVDLEGNYELGDDPVGSIQLLTYFGFCLSDDAVYKNTVDWIHSDQQPLSGHGHPVIAPIEYSKYGRSVVSIVNDLLTHRKEEALEFLKHAALDDGIACESVDSVTGAAVSGRAYASCSGYLSFGLRLALKAATPEIAVVQQKRRPSETLYQPPPETTHDSKKARM